MPDNNKPMKIFLVKSCKECPNITNKRTPGAGYALDYFCTAVKEGNNKIAGYVEYDRETPQEGEFPAFCPLMSV